MTDYAVKDEKLAEQGMLNIELAEKRMPALLTIRERFKKTQPFKGLTIGMALHVTKETAVLVRTLRAGGAKVAISGCNPLSTQDDIAAALAKEGVNVYAHKGESKEEYYKFLERVLSHKPDLTIDDGCDLITLIHTKHTELLSKLIGGCEETTTGIIRLHAMVKDNALKYPVIAVNDNNTKHLLDNYYGTGQSTLDGIFRATNILFAGKTVVVAGYGDCGKGVSLRARGMGANVIVTEVKPFRALQAILDGYRVMPMNEAAKLGDVFITVTGDRDVITVEHVKNMKDGAVLANSGHFDNEIDVAALNKTYKRRKMRPSLDEYKVGNKSIYLCAEGRLVNLGAAEGHPSEVMSTSFCGQALACEFLVKNKGKLKPSVITLPEEVDIEIAKLQLESMGVKIDVLTEEQKKYLASWQEGT
ncbi:Adenosylhomocysteinase [Candidatus Bilamarchaeum dharawalense]|uniref:Adenosylhomocysteinase n=1 Tax=Candidatus Bilamarchaeum dharawalense TaxID=2885759 RepID=A0A5E4LS80_9ARCH|nr:Adenosylhomocysteinase [Candidatus Bilamarchaeum dharawalense]